MSTREEHTAYVDRLTKTVDKRGKELSELSLGRLKKILKMSKGSPQRFLQLVRADRKNFMRAAVEKEKKDFFEAQRIGREFGEKK